MKTFAEVDPLLKGIYWVQDAGACSGVYVLEEGRTIIDAGNMYGLVDELQDLGPLDRLERILVTHAHFDHIGGMEEIYQFTSPDLYLHPVTREYLRLLRDPFPQFFDALEKDGKIKLVNDGDVLQGNPPLKAIHTPGHTAGDLCYFEATSGALFSGDAILPYRYKLGPVLSKPDDVCGGRMQDKVDSIRRLLSVPVRHLFAGHGEPVFDKGGDHVKLTLYSLYQSMNEERPQRAWILMGNDLLEAGLPDDAGQCAAKAHSMAPDDPELAELKGRIEAARGK